MEETSLFERAIENFETQSMGASQEKQVTQGKRASQEKQEIHGK